MVIDLYAAAMLDATRNRNLPQSDWQEVGLFVPGTQRRHIKKHGLFEMLAKHSRHRIFAHDLRRDPSKFSMLFRPLHSLDLKCAACLSGARYIYLHWEGYWLSGTYDPRRVGRRLVDPTN
jgi:ribonuclease J